MLRQTFLGIFAAMLVYSAAPASAELMTPQEIRNTVSGKRILLQTPYGLEFPLVYKPNGQVLGDGTGFGFAALFAPKETGKWWIAENRMCQVFPTWYNGRKFCFTLKKLSPDTLIWQRDDGLEGTARIT